MSAAAPPLTPDLAAALRRLKLATIRAQAPEVRQTARTQRWPADDVLRTLVNAEIAARDQTNQRLCLKAANLPLLKQLEDVDALASGIPSGTFAYVASLEWIRARENTLLVGPAGTGKSHILIGVGHRAVERDCACAMPLPRTSSNSSTAAWPTTPSAASLMACCAFS